MNRRDFIITIVIVLVTAVAARDFVGFTPEIGLQEDGFKVQVAYVLGLYDIGALWDTALDHGLVMVHAFRVLAVSPFLILEAYFGEIASLLLLQLLIVPLIRATPERINPFLTVIPLAMPLVLSGRSVLVAVGLGYVALFLLKERTSFVLFWIGAAFANLSSASVLSVVLLLMFWRRPIQAIGGRWLWRVLALVPLGLSLYASLLEKQYGFTAGVAGYQAFAFNVSGNPILAAISRSTIFVSIIDGQYLRAVVYSAIAIYVLYKVITLTVRSGSRHVQILLLCCAPGILLEGQGVLAMLFPIYWLLLGALTPPKSSPTQIVPAPALHDSADRFDGRSRSAGPLHN